MAHEHRYQAITYGGPQKQVTFKCQNKTDDGEWCKDTFTRDMDEEEQAWLDDHQALSVHTLWHAIHKALPDGWDGTTDPKVKEQIEVAMESFTITHPEQVHMVGVDDSMFMSSLLILVSHEYEKAFMGVTVIVVPQAPDPVVQFFMYPAHWHHLQSVLKVIDKRYAERTVSMGIPGFPDWRENIEQVENREWWSKRAWKGKPNPGGMQDKEAQDDEG